MIGTISMYNAYTRQYLNKDCRMPVWLHLWHIAACIQRSWPLYKQHKHAARLHKRTLVHKHSLYAAALFCSDWQKTGGGACLLWCRNPQPFLQWRKYPYGVEGIPPLLDVSLRVSIGAKDHAVGTFVLRMHQFLRRFHWRRFWHVFFCVQNTNFAERNGNISKIIWWRVRGWKLGVWWYWCDDLILMRRCNTDEMI